MRRRHLLAALPLFATGLIKASAARAAPVLRVGAALPDPPFEFNANDGPAGFDITLMQRIAGMIGREWQLVPTKAEVRGSNHFGCANKIRHFSHFGRLSWQP
jgi:ABC-type amino acid transport substrate-binding protein